MTLPVVAASQVVGHVTLETPAGKLKQILDAAADRHRASFVLFEGTGRPLASTGVEETLHERLGQLSLLVPGDTASDGGPGVSVEGGIVMALDAGTVDSLPSARWLLWTRGDDEATESRLTRCVAWPFS